MKLGKPRKLKRKEVRKLKNELAKRRQRDQASRNTGRKTDKVDRENSKWLRKTLAKVGWIDAGRFGTTATNDAWILTTHCGDLPLMMASIPEIRKDVDAKKLPNGENYATLYDRLQMSRGRKQRFGTQIVQNDKGRHLVFSLEDSRQVDAWRKELRMKTLAESLEMHKRWTRSEVLIQKSF